MAGKGIFDITGKVALVTGASKGLGVVFAEALAEYGADVACAARNEAKLKETVQRVEKYGRRAIAIKADVTDEASVINMVNETVRQMGRIDIFVNNAGVTSPPTRIHEFPTDDWDRIINTNLRGQFLGMKYVIPVMLKQQSGSIINITSIAGLRAEVPEVAPAPYGASKAGIINLTQVAAIEYAGDGIRVNCIAPGIHLTGLGDPEGMDDPKIRAAREKQTGEYCKNWIPMGRGAQPGELKGLMVLLASEASSYITGQVMVQDGGQSSRL